MCVYPDFYLGKCGSQMALFCPQLQAVACPQTQVPQKSMELTLLNFFFCFLMFPNHFPQDSISPWTGNLSLKIPNNVSCLGQTLKSGRLHFAAHEVKAYSIFLRRTNYWHNRLVQYMLESPQEPHIFCFVATRCQSMVRWGIAWRLWKPLLQLGLGQIPQFSTGTRNIDL